MALPRFFVDRPDADFCGTIELPPKAAHHAGRALRLAAGEIVALFNGSGRVWTGPVSFDGKRAFVTIGEETPDDRESPVTMTLVQAQVTPEKMDWIVEKATELGVARIVLVPAQRSVTKLSGDRLEKRLEKCRETVRAACEQCGRNRLPEVVALCARRGSEAHSCAGRPTGHADGKAPQRSLRRGARRRLCAGRIAGGRRSGLAPDPFGSARAAHRNRGACRRRVDQCALRRLCALIRRRALRRGAPRASQRADRALRERSSRLRTRAFAPSRTRRRSLPGACS